MRRMMNGIIFEGPDGAGKSYTARETSRAVGFPVHHFGGPPKSNEEIWKRAEFIFQAKDLIFDRVPIISDQVYGPIIRKEESVFCSAHLTLIPFPVIYCRPSVETIMAVSLEEKEYKSKKQVQLVTERIRQIIEAYDRIMARIPHIKFDRDKQTCAELISLLEKKL